MIKPFIDQIFNDVPPGETVCLSRKGDKGWLQVKASDPRVSEPGPWYFCISTVEDPGPRRKILRRTAAKVRATYVIVLDDIGTKCEPPALAPSYIIETSPGNFHWGYLIEPEIDLEKIQGALAALAAAGLTDPGAQGVNRVMRVPGSLNDKYDPPFVSVLVSMDADRFWSLDDLMAELGVSYEPKTLTIRTGATLPAGVAIDDPVLAWLSERALTVADRGDWVDVVCPWHAAHTEGENTANYSPLGRGEAPDQRGFNCFHGHCEDRRPAEFLEWVVAQGGPNVVTMDTEALAHALAPPEAGALLKVANKAALPDLVMTATRKPAATQLPTTPNLRYVLEALNVVPRFNIMKREIEYSRGSLAEVEDECARVGIRTTEALLSRLHTVAEASSYNPMQDWLTGLEWDGVDRLEALAAMVPVEPEHAEVWPIYVRRWLVQAVQAACGWRDPQQMSGVLVLAGDQGVGKSTWLKGLCPYFTEGASLHLGGYGERDSIVNATRSTVVELGELETTFGKSDNGAIKNFLSRAIDQIRMPYSRDWIELPRASVYCATVNDAAFLLDGTGSRRFWPVTVLRDVSRAPQDMGQVWAQAHELWRQGVTWTLTDDENAMRIANEEDFRAPSSITDMADAYFRRAGEHTLPVTVTDVAMHLLDAGMQSPKALGELHQYLDRRFGRRRRQVQGIRNAYLVPVCEDGLPAALTSRAAWLSSV